MKVYVAQFDGEIRISLAGDDPFVYEVVDGAVEVPDEELDMFLTYVEASDVAFAEPAPPPALEPDAPVEPVMAEPVA